MSLESSSFVREEEVVEGRTMKYLPINRLYSSTSPCVNPSGSSSVMSKKVKARMLNDHEEAREGEDVEQDERTKKEPLIVYRRRNKKPWSGDEGGVGGGVRRPGDSDGNAVKGSLKKPKKNYELLSLDSSGIAGPRLRGSGGLSSKAEVPVIRKRGRPALNKDSSALSMTKRWVELDFDEVDPNVFVGMTCKVFWPMDEDWYKGSVTGYNSATRKHCLEYNDGDVEHLILMVEKIKFHISSEEMHRLNLKYDVSSMEKKGCNYNEMLALAASFDDCQDLEAGDLVWAKLTGKSRIHGFGVFAMLPHKAGDMVIEYTGEAVRPPIADIREHCIYNSLVGAGTYMFRVDSERVIDATRAGSIAHLINHSCEPNCYSRTITVNGDPHIIIFAKRYINLWEELTYDYRFFSDDERLACYCGFPRCRRVVNDIESDEQRAKILVPRSDLVPWK